MCVRSVRSVVCEGVLCVCVECCVCGMRGWSVCTCEIVCGVLCVGVVCVRWGVFSFFADQAFNICACLISVSAAIPRKLNP